MSRSTREILGQVAGAFVVLTLITLLVSQLWVSASAHDWYRVTVLSALVYIIAEQAK